MQKLFLSITYQLYAVQVEKTRAKVGSLFKTGLLSIDLKDVHDHANKEGGIRGSSRKEDVLDNVLCLRRPDDFDESKDGAKFEVHFTKARSLFGEDIKPIIASLDSNSGKWSWSNLASKQEQACELFNQGMSQVDIAKILDVNKSTVSRWISVAQGKK